MFGFFNSSKEKATPQQVGYLIAGAIPFACLKNNLSKQEIELLASAKVPGDIYWKERISLAAFAAEWGYYRTLAPNPIVNAVRQGFRDGWSEFGAKSQLNASIVNGFGERFAKYAKAAMKEEEQEAGVLGSTMEWAFCDFLEVASGMDRSIMPSGGDIAALMAAMSEDEKREIARFTFTGILGTLVVNSLYPGCQQMAMQQLREHGAARTECRSCGSDEAAPGLISLTITVPALVPSDFHSSSP